MQLPSGTRFGAYEIRSPLGEGGMGEVYRAHDTTLGRDVALKLIAAPFASDPTRLARFAREARMLASLNHPGIAAIYGFENESVGSNQPPVPALVLELIEGETLAHRIARGPVALADAVKIARQIADALDFAHQRGVIHRDLKPANIKITSGGAVKLLDFGLAKALTPDQDADPAATATITSHGTRVGEIVGTPAYMSPEQTRGLALDKRTDIWAFGCVLHEMLTGRVAFNAATVSDTIACVLHNEPDVSAFPRSTPEAIRRIVHRCLQKDVAHRFRDIGDVRIELDDAFAPRGGEANAAATHRSTMPRYLTASLIALAAVGGAALGWFLASTRVAATVTPPSFDRLVPFAATSAHEFAPVISPDGKWIAFLSDARGPTDVWVKFVAGGEPVNLTASSGLTVQSQDGIAGLAVSPDGSQIGFQAQAAMQLISGWVVPAPLGGSPRPVLPAGRSGMQWSADGKRIAYIMSGGPLGDALMVADSDGQNEIALVKREGARHVHWVRWDPASTYIYFNYGIQNANSEQTQIFRVPVAGGAPERVVATGRRAVAPFPMSDGLFFAGNPDSVDLNLWWRHFASGRDYRITTGVGEYGAPSLSTDGQRLVGTVLQVRQSLERADVRFDRPAKLERLPTGSSGDLDPVWSPEGARLIFSSSRAGHRTLWSTRGDLTQTAQLTTGAAMDERSAYSPDGRQIAFVSDRGGQRGIWLISAQGGAPRLASMVDVVDSISWSPDGRRLVFSTPIGDAPGLMTLDVATGQLVRVPTPAAAATPAWSPREDVIAYVEPRGGGVGAFVKFVTSSGQVVHDRGDMMERQQFGNGALAWSPDGRRVAAISAPGAFAGSIWIIEPTAPTPFRKLLDLPAGDLIRGVTWSRDGSAVVVGRIQRSGDIFLAERDRQP